jgi:hypothetical protein
MRYLGAIGFFFAVFSWVVIFAGPPSGAAAEPAQPASQTPLTGLTAPLQQSGDTWTTTVYLGTAALCQGAVSYDLVTTVPYSATLDTSPKYVVPGSNPQRTADHPPCATQNANPDAEALLSFTPSPALTAAPQTATLVVTPVGVAVPGAMPLDITLTVHRQVSASQYVWIPVGCGLVLAVLLVLLTMAIGVSYEGGTVHGHRGKFWTVPLYAASAWTFGDSWATNVTAVGTVVGAVLTASGSVADLLPGIELGRFGLLIALAGGITAVAPLLFGVLNYLFRSDDVVAPEDKKEVVAAQMRTMLAASFLTVFGIGAEIGIVGWVLGHDLAVAPPLAHVLSLVIGGLAALLVLGYGFFAIRALADPDTGTPLSAPRNSSFML